MSESRRVVTNSGFLFARNAITMALSVFLLGFVLRYVSSEAYGIYLLVLGWRTFIGLVGMCVKKGCIVWTARGIESSREVDVGRVVTTASICLALPAALFAFGAWALGESVAAFFGLSGELELAMVRILLLAGFETLILLPLMPFEGLIEGQQRYDVTSSIDIAGNGVRAALIVALMMVTQPHVEFVMLASVIATLLRMTAVTSIAFLMHPELRVGPSQFDRGLARELTAYSGTLIFSQSMYSGSEEVPLWIAGKALGASYVTYLGIPLFFAKALTQVVTNVTLVLVPMASQYQTREDDDGLRDILLRGTRYSALVGAAAMAVAIPTLGPFLALWVGGEYVWLVPYVAAFCGALILYVPHNAALQVLEGTADATRPALGRALQLGVTTGVAAAGVTVFAGGLEWVLVGLAAGYLSNAALLSWIAMRRWQLPARDLLWQGYLQPWLAVLPTAFTAAALTHALEPSHWLSLLAVWLGAVAILPIGCLWLLQPREWQVLRAAVRRVRG